MFSDRWLCVTDAKNPHLRNGTLSRAKYLQLPHLVYGIGEDRQLNLADQHLEEMGVRRRIDVTVESFLLVPFLLKGTPMVSLILERAASRLGSVAGVCTFKPPVSLPDIHEAMYWHPRHTADPGHRWLRERLQAIAAELG
jgi:DNA-binding transcriptional LysR family regulator